MPPITGARPAPFTLDPVPHSIQPSRQPGGLSFKAVQRLVQRAHKWQPGARAATHEPFTLLRGEHESRVNKAARCRARIAETAGRLYANADRPPDPVQLAQLERDEAKLQGQTQVHASMRGVLLERAVRAYVPDTGARQAKQRTKALIKARQGPLAPRQSAQPAPAALGQARESGTARRALGHILESATALEASASPVKALGREYRAGDGRIKLSAEMVHDLTTLLNSMKMLRRHDQDPADFLYPAMKAMHEANPGEVQGTGGTALMHLLRDLGGPNRDDPRGLRAQLTRHGGGLDFWLANNDASSSDTPSAAARLGLVDEMNTLLDGLAGAARQVWREALQDRVPAWAAGAQAGLFQEAGVLYRSAQRWRDHGLERGAAEQILLASPADAVGSVLEHAANEALGTSAAPPDYLAPLMSGLKPRLDQIAQHIEQALGTAAAHTSADDIAVLRQTLMRDVLVETGILGEIHRLRESAAAPAASAPPAPGPGGRDGRIMLSAFRPDSGQLHSKIVRGVKHAAADARRQIIKVLSACQQGNGKPLSRHTLQALNNAYAGLVNKHGETSAPAVWQDLLDGETMRLKNGDLQNLNSSALRAHVHGRANLTSKLADPDARAASDKLLGDLWASLRTASARRNAGPFLKTWCAGLSTPAGMDDGTTLFFQVEGLRDRIGQLDDGTVNTTTLLNATMRDLSHAELDALIAVLAATPAEDMATQPAQGLAATSTQVMATQPTQDGATRPAADMTQAPSATRGAGTGTLTLPQRLMRYLRRDFGRPAEDTGAPVRQQTDTLTFVGQLYDAARTQAEARMESLRDSLVKDFRAILFTQTGLLQATLDTPEAHAVNGPAAAVLERLIRDAVEQGRHIHRIRPYGADAAIAMAGTRFLRTANGYDVARDLTQPLSRATAALHARLQEGMKEVGILRFRSDTTAEAWREVAVDQIVRDTGIWGQMDYAVWRHTPRNTARRVDIPSLAGDGLRASFRRGGTRASTQSTQSVDRHGFAKPISIFNRPATTSAATPVAQDVHATAGLAVAGSTRPASAVYSHDGDRAGTVISDDSDRGSMVIPDDSDRASTVSYDHSDQASTVIYDDNDRASTIISDDTGLGGSRLSLDTEGYGTLRKPLRPTRKAPPPPFSEHAPPPPRSVHAPTPRASDGPMAAHVDPALAAALRAALEQRNRGQWNRA